MAKTLVVGDSVAAGIGGAIAGAQVFAQNSLRIDQMQSYFDRTIAAAGQGDTVIISAGYNSTGSNGLSQSDLNLLQSNIDQLVAKGAHVVIAPLRETGMTADYARLNGQTARTNTQLRGLRNATVADQCVAAANGIAGGEIHGAYPDLARICRAASTAAIAVTSRSTGRGGRRTTATGAPASPDEETDGQTPPPAAPAKASAGGFMAFLQPIIDFFVDLFRTIFGGALAASPAAEPAATPAAGTPPPAQPVANPALAQEQARAAAATTVSGGQNVTASGAPNLRLAAAGASAQRALG